MRYLKIQVEPIKLKGDPEDSETLQADVYERLQCMIEAETLAFEILEDEEEDED